MILPHITVYTDSLDDGVGGTTKGPLIFIRPQYKDDVGIHKHEEVHVTQWYAGFGIGLAIAAAMYFNAIDGYPLAILLGMVLHPLATTSKRYTFWKEVVAYREQAKHYPEDRRLLFASFIATNYGLSVTIEQAYAALMKD